MELLYWFESIRFPILDEIMLLLTRFGEETLFLVAAMTMLWCVDKRKSYYLLAVGFLGLISNQFLKITFRIPRPWVLDPEFTILEQAREAAADAQACVGTSVRVLESNSGDALTFWAGTKEQYDAIPEKVTNCMYIITDDTTGEDLAKACADAAAAAAEALAYSAGYGLGGYGKNITISDIADLDGITANGWYSFDIPDWIADTADFGGINVHSATMRVDSSSGNICRQTLYPVGNYATSIVRLKYISWDLTAKWSPWYVEHPPMDTGVEYRTTERWLGSTVYAKRIDLGSLSNGNSSFAYQIAETGAFSEIVDYKCLCIVNGVTASLDVAPWAEVHFDASDNRLIVRITSTEVTSYSYTGIAWVKYTKG